MTALVSLHKRGRSDISHHGARLPCEASGRRKALGRAEAQQNAVSLFHAGDAVLQHLHLGAVRARYSRSCSSLRQSGVIAEFFAQPSAYVMLTEKETDKRGVKIQGIYRSNFVIIGLPLATALVPGADAGRGRHAHLPSSFRCSTPSPSMTLELFSGSRPSALGSIMADVLKNPLILGTIVGHCVPAARH